MRRPSYSMCWEDYRVVEHALRPVEDSRVLSIASGGENVFSLALHNPETLTAVDIDPTQLAVSKLKAAAIKTMDFDEVASFLGYLPSAKRLQQYKSLRNRLSETDVEHLDLSWVEQGIIHAGKLESYLHKFRSFILPLVLKKEGIEEYLSLTSLEDQKEFYENRWNNWRWKGLFNVFFSKTVMQRSGRRKEYFEHADGVRPGKEYFGRAKRGITQIPVVNNHYMQYILTGRVQLPVHRHPYLDPDNFSRLKNVVEDIEFVRGDILSFLDDRFNRFNLSDVFELYPESVHKESVERIVSLPDARGCYWTNLVRREANPQHLDLDVQQIARDSDRVFFYSGAQVLASTSHGGRQESRPDQTEFHDTTLPHQP